jgi:hypothetical protein
MNQITLPAADLKQALKQTRFWKCTETTSSRMMFLAMDGQDKWRFVLAESLQAVIRIQFQGLFNR